MRYKTREDQDEGRLSGDAALRGWLHVLGAVDMLKQGADYVYDLLPESDRKVHEAYDALIEAAEVFQQAVSRAAQVGEEEW